jgi:hypothetical protein
MKQTVAVGVVRVIEKKHVEAKKRKSTFYAAPPQQRISFT